MMPMTTSSSTSVNAAWSRVDGEPDSEVAQQHVNTRYEQWSSIIPRNGRHDLVSLVIRIPFLIPRIGSGRGARVFGGSAGLRGVGLGSTGEDLGWRMCDAAE